jgi:RNA polymerase sigma factor (sigma-70 family)
MARSVAHVLAQMQRWTTAAPRSEISDAGLLERYVHRREEAAFAALVARHGGMVLRLCRRVLSDANAAEDAFQAVFLILARKAHALKQPDALPAWLYGVARRVALKARGQSIGLLSSAPLDESLPDPRPDPLTQLTARELLDILHEELQRLPAVQRSAVVLCCLEGRTREEAAGILGWTIGSLRGHLERGRQRLQERLARRDITLSTALAIAAVSSGEAASALLLQNTVTAALSGGIGSSAAALAHSVLKGMLLSKLAGVMAVVLTVAVAVSATVAVVYRPSSVEHPQDNSPIAAVPKAPDAGKPPARTDALGDPLPEGAIARLGTVRLRHGGTILKLAFTPDGKQIVAFGHDGVRIWDAATGREARDFLPTSRFIHVGSPSSDGERIHLLDSSSKGCFLRTYERSTLKQIRVVELGLTHWFHLSPNDRLIAAGIHFGPALELWDIRERRRLRAWEAHRGRVTACAFSSDSKILITSGDKTIRFWDVATGERLREIACTSPAWPLALSADGTLLAAASWNQGAASPWGNRVRIWDVARGQEIHQLTQPDKISPSQSANGFTFLRFAPDGKTLVTASLDGAVRFWDAARGKETRHLPLGAYGAATLCFSPDGKTLAIPANNVTLRLIDVASGKDKISFAAPSTRVRALAVSPSADTVVTSNYDGSEQVWDAKTGRPGRLAASSSCPRILADGRALLLTGEDGVKRLWSLASDVRRRLAPSVDLAAGLLDVTPDGRLLAATEKTSSKTIVIRETSTGAQRVALDGHAQMVIGARFAAAGRTLISWCGDHTVHVWDVPSGRRLRQFPLPGESRSQQGELFLHYLAAVAPDGRAIAYGGSDSRLALCDLADGKEVWRTSVLEYPPTAALAFSPDGRTLVWCGWGDSVLHLVETATGRERHRLLGHKGDSQALAFSADGKVLVSGSGDTTALVWDLSVRADPRPATAAELKTFWAELAGADASLAYRAIRKLAASPSSAIPFMRERLHSIPVVSDKQLARLVTDLDSDDFTVRQKSTAELEKLGKLALPAYRQALQGKPSLEARRRLEDLLDKAQRDWWGQSGERLRSLRAVEALELAGTEPARELLKTLAAGAEGARLTAEAKQALERLANRARK